MATVLQRKRNLFQHEKAKKTTSSDLQAADNIEDLKEKMLDMQMEIVILKETIHVLKKDPRHRSDGSQEQREGSDHRRPEE